MHSYQPPHLGSRPGSSATKARFLMHSYQPPHFGSTEPDSGTLSSRSSRGVAVVDDSWPGQQPKQPHHHSGSTSGSSTSRFVRSCTTCCTAGLPALEATDENARRNGGVTSLSISSTDGVEVGEESSEVELGRGTTTVSDWGRAEASKLVRLSQLN